MRTIASVGASILGSGTSSQLTSRLPCHTSAFMTPPAEASRGDAAASSMPRRAPSPPSISDRDSEKEDREHAEHGDVDRDQGERADGQQRGARMTWAPAHRLAGREALHAAASRALDLDLE